jgi:SagB-type dehydrogenase family enzyme
MPHEKTMKLPAMRPSDRYPLETLLAHRRSVREFIDRPMTLEQISKLLWAAQGITGEGGLRTAPSAGALYPLELYLIAGNVDGLETGIHHYHPQTHTLEARMEGDHRDDLAAAALGQYWISGASAVLAFAAVYERTMEKYGKQGIQYVHMEIGHAVQNVFLEAVSLGLGTCVVGAFHGEHVKRVVGLKDEETPLCLMPLGWPA